MVKFGTLEYYKQIADWLEKDEEWKKAALTFNFGYVITDVMGADGTPKAFIMKFENGKVTSVSEAKAAEATAKEIDVGTTATYAIHAGIAKGEINAQKAKLKLNMMKVMKNQNALKRQSAAMKELKGVEY